MNRNRHDKPVQAKLTRKRIVLTGILQGIGCRPTVYRLATRLGLAGWVVNTTSGVRIEIEGIQDQCDRFLEELPHVIPYPGRIDNTADQEITPIGETAFRIETSLEGERTITPIPPDVAMCQECIEEMLDRRNRRFLFPFTTCTLCGPRFTVVRSFPYDRERTSMADFSMCGECRREYETPHDRRFHSQTNSCPECGPRLTLASSAGDTVGGDPIPEAVGLLKAGKILAIKGIGGFHLACDALNEAAVRMLRDRKGRAEKPFAVMMPNLETVRRYCELTPVEEQLLSSPVAPIVLLPTREEEQTAESVAPLVGTLGVILPYSPVHHLLFNHSAIPPEENLTVLVMTSGNRSEEPIVRGNQEALERLGDLVDAFLLHDREIVLSADDSIFRVIAGRPTVFRRSRGLVPGEFKMPLPSPLTRPSPDRGEGFELPALDRRGKGKGCDSLTSLTLVPHPDACEPFLLKQLQGTDEGAPEKGNVSQVKGVNLVVLGAGGDLKNCPAVLKGDQIVPGPHVGDLASPVAQDYFKHSAHVLTEYLETTPDLIAVDPHPEYFSTSLAREMNADVIEVFHHHAHAVSLLFEHGIRGPALFAVFDGTGYGTDGSIWGGEFLLADMEHFQRLGHIGIFHLPGGEAAIREPVRILAALLAQAHDGRVPERFVPLMGEHAHRAELWIEAVKKRINAPATSSAGRLFDSAAAAVGFLRPVTFEGQAAMWLESIAKGNTFDPYPVVIEGADPMVVDPAALMVNVADDMLRNCDSGRISARFHATVAMMISQTIGKLAQQTGITTVGLSGGCFQNKLLTEYTLALLEAQKLKVLLHKSIPPNDGGIAVGQAVTAWTRHAGSD